MQFGSEFTIAHIGLYDINNHLNSKETKIWFLGLAGSSKKSTSFKNINLLDNEN